ncbi:MAG TPA: AI-2E family transporter, partial [Thermoanaerobaculia bacterium]|nr:AI-2E family transporter [Thermoanaerobaculia bacterium]
AWIAHPLLLASFLGVLFGLAVARGVDYLTRFRIPRGIAATLIVLGFYGLVAGLVALAAPTLRTQFRELGERLPEASQRIDAWVARHEGDFLGQLMTGRAAGETAAGSTAGQADAARGPAGATGARGEAARAPRDVSRERLQQGAQVGAQEGAQQPAQTENGGAASLRDSLTGQIGAVVGYLFSFLTSTIAVVAGLLLITFLAIFIGAEPDLYRDGLLHLIPRGARPRATHVLDEVGTTLRRWLVTQLIAMVVIGVVTTLVLWMLGVESALSLGLIAGLLEFIPNVGPVLASLPAIGMAFLDSPQKALWVAIAYILIQFFENHVLIPLLMKHGVDLPPALTVIGAALMAIAFGFLGLLVAVPLIAAVVVAVKMLYVEDVVGEDMDMNEAKPTEAG